LKKGYPILIISGTHIHDTTAHQMFSFPPYPTSASALPGKNRTDKICIKINKKVVFLYMWQATANQLQGLTVMQQHVY